MQALPPQRGIKKWNMGTKVEERQTEREEVIIETV
jgi:hypothetical protein